jgi:hypothetical protein
LAAAIKKRMLETHGGSQGIQKIDHAGPEQSRTIERDPEAKDDGVGRQPAIQPDRGQQPDPGWIPARASIGGSVPPAA